MISRYLKSACHGAPVVQTYEQATDLFPITCTACGQELGAPGGEDVRCCDLHNVHCEPPSELCCPQCTEVEHPQHRDQTCVHEQLERALRSAGHTGGFSRGAPPLDTRLNLFSLSPRGAGDG